jgi:hypothetical protein
LLRKADECLDDGGKVLFGKKKVIESWEQKTGLHFMHNSLFALTLQWQMTSGCSL